MSKYLTIKEFANYANDPDWYIESWCGTAIGPGNYTQYADDYDGLIHCDIDEYDKTICVY